MSRDIGGLPGRGEWDEKQSYTPGQLARVCRTGPSLPRQWATRGLVPCHVTLGGHRRYWRPNLPFLPTLGDPQLLTLADAAFLLSVHPSTVREWVVSGQLYGVRLPGGGHRVWRQDVDKLLSRIPVSHGK